MPVIRTTVIEGYDDDTKRRLAERLTDAVRSVIAAPLDGVTVVIEEVAASGYMRGRQTRRPGAPAASGSTVVRDYLAAMEARDLERASVFLADGFVMTFPGGARFTRPQEVVEWSRSRYRDVRKRYESFDETFSEAGTIVYCHGTLEGEWTDGSPFAGIRFVDRFLVRDGRLVEQQVWNDLAESRNAGG